MLYGGLLLPAVAGFFWMERWLYGKMEASSHFMFILPIIVLMAIMAFSFWKASPREILFATLLPLPAFAVGAVLGGIFGRFFHENLEGRTKPPNN